MFFFGNRWVYENLKLSKEKQLHYVKVMRCREIIVIIIFIGCRVFGQVKIWVGPVNGDVGKEEQRSPEERSENES